MYRAPWNPSSPGWNMNSTRPASRSRRWASTRAAEASIATWVSCPQACMIPSTSEANASPVSSGIGSASMSPRSSTVGPGRSPSSTATTELTERPRCTCNGRSARAATTASWVRGSSRPSSGCRCSARRSATVRGCTLRASAWRPVIDPSGGMGRSWRAVDAAGHPRTVVWTTVEGAYRSLMAVQSVQAREDLQGQALPGYAVAAIREDGRWRCTRLTSDALVDLDTAITELRELRSTGAVLGLLDVDDEFFVLLRPTPGGVALMVSDAVAALDYDVAADVLDLLRVELPADDDALDDPWPEGDLSIVADLGLPADELEVLAGGGRALPRRAAGRDRPSLRVRRGPRRGRRHPVTARSEGGARIDTARSEGGARIDTARSEGRRSTARTGDDGTVRIGSTAPAPGDEALVRRALEVAAAAPRTGDVPIGAVVVDPAGRELAAACNGREAFGDPTAHAEVLALRAAAAVSGEWRLEGCTIAVTVEPCTMCAGAIGLARVARVVFGTWEPRTGAVGSLWDVLRDRRLNHRPEVVAGVLADECATLLESFFADHR